MITIISDFWKFSAKKYIFKMHQKNKQKQAAFLV
jgi:hypothetical protein